MGDELIVRYEGRQIPVVRPREKWNCGESRSLMAEHLLHELEALGAFFVLTSMHGPSEGQDYAERSEGWWLGHAVVEVFLLHVRILDEFLYGDLIAIEKGRKSPIDLQRDASALDFVRDQQLWLDERPRRPAALRRQRINRTVAHLSWDSVRGGWDDQDLSFAHNPREKRQHWPPGEMWQAIRDPLQSFLTHLDWTGLCEDFQERARLALETKAILGSHGGADMAG